MDIEQHIAELQEAIMRWARQVDKLEAERDHLKQELQELRERYTGETRQDGSS